MRLLRNGPFIRDEQRAGFVLITPPLLKDLTFRIKDYVYNYSDIIHTT